MKPLKPRLVRALVIVALVGMIVAITLRQQAIARLRQENRELAIAVQEVNRLRSENADFPRLQTAQAEVVELRRGLDDLPRLRNEVRQLKRQTGELAALRAENQRLQAPATNSPVTPFIAADAMVDRGQASPESTVETFFWAVARGNAERALDCLYHEPGSPPRTAEMAKGMLANFPANFPGFRVLSSQRTAPDHAIVSIQTVVGGETAPMPLILVDGKWVLQGP